MNKLMSLCATLALCVPLPALAEPQVKPYSLEAMGCMKLEECKKGVKRVKTADDVIAHFGNNWFGVLHGQQFEQEFIALMDRLDAVGVRVYIAESRYFPRTHRGSYYTDTNTFFLNEDWMQSPDVFMKVLRHEGWHAAQDCMAGSIDNTFIAVILDDETIPDRYKLDADLRYGLLQPRAIPWEQEAIYAADVPNMTADALNACSSGSMWTEYPPTPMTKEWLEEQGYIK